MTGKNNLKPPRSTDEARERGRKGGKASGAARRAKRDAKETALLFLNLPAAGQLDDNLEKLEVKLLDRTNLMGIIARLTLLSQSGNVNAARLIMEVAGYMPKNNPENNLNVSIGKDEDLKVVLYVPDNGIDKTEE